jgi:hypothetical protein
MSEEEGEAPEELSQEWDDEIKAAYHTLKEKHQVFLLAYLRCWNAAKAYREVYNPLADGQTASNCGSRMLGTAGAQTILKRFTDTRTEDLLMVKAVFKEAATEAVKPIFGKDENGQPTHIEDIPDYDVRVKAGIQVAKLAKLYAEDEAFDPDNPTNKDRPINIIKINGASLEIA